MELGEEHLWKTVIHITCKTGENGGGRMKSLNFQSDQNGPGYSNWMNVNYVGNVMGMIQPSFWDSGLRYNGGGGSG